LWGETVTEGGDPSASSSPYIKTWSSSGESIARLKGVGKGWTF